ncbi:MAG: peptide ABC transporter ATP-binding protein, partial [Deltaproteobacteria bacterium]
LFERPLHPYTKGLLRSLPPLDGGERKLTPIPGLVPDLSHVPPGCPFYDRCDVRMEICREEFPRYISPADEHRVACHFVEKETAR